MTRYVSAEQLAARYGVDKSTIWRWAKRGILPKPVPFTGACTRWNLDEIDKRDAEREAQAEKVA